MVEIKAGEKELVCCPLCLAKFSEPVETNVKMQCPEEGGCGRFFLVRVFDN